jgi:hypothetical protein
MVKLVLVLMLVVAIMSLHMVVGQTEEPTDPAKRRRPRKKSPSGRRSKGDPSIFGNGEEKLKQYGSDKGRPKHEWAADGAAGIIEGDIELGRKSRNRARRRRKAPPGDGDGGDEDKGRRAARLAKLEHRKERMAEKVIGTRTLPHWSTMALACILETRSIC